MTETKKSYYAIIPANVRYDKRLTPNAKLLYGEITALCNEKGYCWASNGYFADLYEVTKVCVSRWIKQLIDCKYITSKLKFDKDTNQIVSRYIQICLDPINKIVNTPINKIVKDNTTQYNTTINNIFTFWNEQNIIKHIKINDKLKNKIKSILKDYSYDNIKKSIQNYKTVLNDKDSFFTFKWTLIDFLQRGLDKFLADESLNNYKTFNSISVPVPAQSPAEKLEAEKKHNQKCIEFEIRGLQEAIANTIDKNEIEKIKKQIEKLKGGDKKLK